MLEVASIGHPGDVCRENRMDIGLHGCHAEDVRIRRGLALPAGAYTAAHGYLKSPIGCVTMGGPFNVDGIGITNA